MTFNGDRPTLTQAPAWSSQPLQPQPLQTRRRRRGGYVRLLVLIAVLVALVAAAGRQGILPEWVPMRDVFAGAQPQAPEVDYPVFGSSALVTYLAASMVEQDESIDVTYWANQPDVGREGIFDAAAEAVVQNPYVFADGWTLITSVTGVSLKPDYVYRDALADSMRGELQDAVAAGLEKAKVTAEMDPAKKATRIHEYLAAVATYDEQAADSILAGVTDTDNVQRSQEAYGILVDGTAVCNGYAQAFQVMAAAAGLPSVIVTGQANGGLTTGAHAWNRVLVDGTWQVVDVTWDDVDTKFARTDYLLVPPGDEKLSTRAEDLEWVVDANADLYGG